jgi:SAM-dependent methyltransferase
MYCRSESLGTFKTILDESPDDIRSLFHELGFAIVKNNLAIRQPGFPAKSLKSQYEHMLGISLADRHRLNLKEVIDPCSFDVLGRLHEDLVRTNGTRKMAGEFYTPTFAVDYMVGLLDLDSDDRLEGRKFIDIACGTGAFLVAGMRKAIRLLKKRRINDDAILQIAVNNFYGWDISPTAVDVCKINLYLVLLHELGPVTLARAGRIRPNLSVTNAIDNRDRSPGDDSGFDYVLGNPPYLEAKRMPAETREICRSGWPELTGAFDLYIPFILQCNRLVSAGGRICLILPDKFAVAKYAARLRETLLDRYNLIELADLSEMGVFHRAMVYPAVIAYSKSAPSAGHRVRTRMSVRSPEELVGRTGCATVSQSLYRAIGHNKTLFCLPEKGDTAEMLRHMFKEAAPIGKYVDFRSTVSFHKKGLREQFVRLEPDGGTGPVCKYLGGQSYARKNEVGLFRFCWEGYYIDYDQEKLKEYDNVLPPLSNFLQEKIVLCQHARRITVAYDGGGEFVTKDVYPIGIAARGLAGSPLSIKYFTALLNSELMSFVYGTVYKGIQIGGGYYHYLPTWLDILPVTMPEKREISAIEALADGMIAANDRATRLRLMQEADAIFYEAYGVGDVQRSIIRATVPPWATNGD